ncbi:MAG: hypothetical protein AABW58_02860 [Nanoarchaeota archaeon]
MNYDDLVWEFEVDDDLVLNHPIMEPQRHHRQLGQIEKLISGASHTRLNHSGYARKVAKVICRVLKERGRLPAPENDIIHATGLHDMGHPPFSHAVEYVLREFDNGKTHHERGLELLDSDIRDGKGRTIRDVLEIYDADPECVKKLLTGADPKKGGHPASKIITDKTLGADKLAYTIMDAVMAGFYQLPPNWRRLVPSITFFRDDIGFDIYMEFGKLEHQVQMLTAGQDTHFRMYSGLYLTAPSLAAERHLQKSTEFGIRGGILVPEKTWSMGDVELITAIASSKSKDELIKRAQDILMGYQLKQFYVPVVSFKFKQFEIDKFADEVVVPIERNFSSAFLEAFSNPLRLTELEDELEKELKIPVLVSVLPDPQKVKPGEVNLYQNGTYKGTLRDLVPMHYAKLEEEAARAFSISLLVPAHERANTTRRYKEVADLFLERSKNYMQRTPGKLFKEPVKT